MTTGTTTDYSEPCGTSTVSISVRLPYRGTECFIETPLDSVSASDHTVTQAEFFTCCRLTRWCKAESRMTISERLTARTAPSQPLSRFG